MLNDEELALLLHQELNSSLRVPRARQTGSLPQLTSTSATNMLMKRASVGGKDNYLVCKRKYKDATRDGVCSSREPKDAHVKEEGRHACVTTANSIISNVVSKTSATENNSKKTPPQIQLLLQNQKKSNSQVRHQHGKLQATITSQRRSRGSVAVTA